MGNKLFIGGLSWDTNNEGLQKAFGQYGEIEEAKVITDRETGRSRGFGFITFADERAAGEALNQMNGQELDGRTLKVDFAQDKPRRDGGGRRGGGGYGGGGGDRW